MKDSAERPVLSGLIALLAVAVAVGVLGGAALVLGARVLGVGGSDGGESSNAGDSATLYLPEPKETEPTTVEPSSSEPEVLPTETVEPVLTFTLTAAAPSVAPMAQIDLAGTHPTDGAILQVQRFEDGQWVDFPVTASVSGQQFTTYVQTGRAGVNKFRMIDTDSGETSTEVEVTVG